jgi:hypothetical protein
MSIRIGAPGSIARHVQETLEHNPRHFGTGRYCVYSYGAGPVPILHASYATQTQAQAESTAKPGSLWIDTAAYLPRRAAL